MEHDETTSTTAAAGKTLRPQQEVLEEVSYQLYLGRDKAGESGSEQGDWSDATYLYEQSLKLGAGVVVIPETLTKIPLYTS